LDEHTYVHPAHHRRADIHNKTRVGHLLQFCRGHVHGHCVHDDLRPIPEHEFTCKELETSEAQQDEDAQTKFHPVFNDYIFWGLGLCS
jgi:hypothetical protein